MKALKYLVVAVFGLAGFAVLALGVAVAVIDGDFVKARLERAMKEKNRTLAIEGTPRLTLYPVASIALGKTTLTEPGSDRLFVGLESAEIAVRAMPLLSGELQLEKLRLAGLKANVVKGKDGRLNFADLAGPPPAAQPAEAVRRADKPLKIRIAEVGIERAELSFRDEASGQQVRIGELELKTGRLDGSAPGPVAMSAHLTGTKPDLDLKARMSGALRFDLARQEIAFDGFKLEAKGRVDRDTLAAEFAAPKVEITPARAGGEEVRGSVQLKGPQRNANVVFRVEGIQGTARDLALGAVALDIDAATGANSVKGKVATPVRGNLEARTWELPKIAANLTLAGPAIPQKTVTLPIQGAAKADLAQQSASLDLSTKFDESSVQAKLGATRFAPLAATFDVKIDRLNLDRYLPPEKKDGKEAKDERIDLSGLRGPTVSGSLQIGSLVARRVKMENVKAQVKLAGGRLEVAPHSAALYGGTLTGSISADANGNRIAVKENLQNVAIGPLLRDAAQKDVIEGKGNVAIDVTTAGGTVTALKKALGGSARIEMKDGAIKGVNLADTGRALKSAVGGRQTKPDPTQKTDFTELSASFDIKSGVARNDDLKAASPYVRLGGAGNLDIGNNTIDYLAKATLVATSKGQGGREVGEVAGVTIPVKLSGALDNPSWNIDYTALAGGGAGAVGKAAGSVAETVKKGAGGLGEAVRGLFGR